MSGVESQQQWAQAMLMAIHLELTSDQHLPSTSEVLAAVDQLRVASDPKLAPAEACLILEELEQQCEAGIKAESAKHQAVSLLTRWLYSESRLVHSLIQLRHPKIVQHVKQWEESVKRLDMAIIISGAPGNGCLNLILDTIDCVQSTHLPPKEDFLVKSGPKAIRPCTPALNSHDWAPTGIPHIVPPSLSGFRVASNSPFILSGFLRNWPALTDHDWSSASYLLQVAGQGRVVPVEIGSDYREDDWSQKLMGWEAFLQNIGILPSDEHNKNNDSSEPQSRPILYLAQHNLFTQFPKLRSDIIIPDYVYSSPQAPSFFPAYKPPGNEEQLVINAWLGPRGTISPAHTDPYFNCYCQVVGRKTVWLAPPYQKEMYPFSDPAAPHSTHVVPESDGTLPISEQATIPLLNNTSQVDVFNPSKSTFPLFESIVRPESMCSVLEPGDLLYIPPGWWHAMRSEDTSFSVSMWF